MKTILLIEDDANLAELVKIRLEEHDYQIVIVPDGFEMLKILRKTKPDLIILDVMLPRIDGYKLCRLLKNYEPYKNIPIIIFTALTGKGSKAMAKDMGAETYIAKPFDSKKLISEIDRILKID
jgi:DNA-binding response OmpR family regulator